MQAILIALILTLTCKALAATPFVSVGIAPMMTNLKYNGDEHYFDNYENTFYARGSVLNLGLLAGRAEWYARVSWNKSAEASKYSEILEDNGQSFFKQKFNDLDRWQDTRLTLGHRWLFPQRDLHKLTAFVGIALSTGTAKWHRTREIRSERFNFEYEEQFYDTIITASTKSSKYSYGGTIEAGARVPIFKTMSIEASAQLSGNKSGFGEENSNGGEFNYAATSVEPLLLLALRWDLPFVNIRSRETTTNGNSKLKQ